MKKYLSTIVFVCLPTFSFANEITFFYPEEKCASIVAADFSSPGSDSSRYTFEVLCKDNENKYVMFMTDWMSGASFIGFSRAGTPDVINLTPRKGIETIILQK